MHALYPVTITTKITECKEFYCRLFGFEAVFEADWYVQLLHTHSGAEIGLMQPHFCVRDPSGVTVDVVQQAEESNK